MRFCASLLFVALAACAAPVSARGVWPIPKPPEEASIAPFIAFQLPVPWRPIETKDSDQARLQREGSPAVITVLWETAFPGEEIETVAASAARTAALSFKEKGYALDGSEPIPFILSEESASFSFTGSGSAGRLMASFWYVKHVGGHGIFDFWVTIMALGPAEEASSLSVAVARIHDTARLRLAPSSP